MAPGIEIHLFLRGLVGAGMGLVNPIRTSLIADHYQGEERAKMFGDSLAFSKLVAIMIPLLATWLSAGNWRNAFTVYLIGPIILILVLTMHQSSTEDTVREERKINKSPVPFVVYLYTAGVLILMCLFFVLITDLSYLVSSKEEISPMVAAFGISATTIGTTIAGFIFSKIFMKIQKLCISAGSFACGAGFLLAVHTHSNSGILIGLFCAGFGLGILLSVITLLATNTVGDEDSTAANALVGSGTSLGIAISPIIFGQLPTIFEGMAAVQSNFQLVGTLFLGAGFISLFIWTILRFSVKN